MSTASTKESALVMPLILQRHYSTIGIQDVFLKGPPHPFPSQYLQTRTLDTSFTSWEIVGTIKEAPEDFCVREIFQRGRVIPGIMEEDHPRLQVANILPPGELPKQRLDREETKDVKPIKLSPPPGAVIADNVAIPDDPKEIDSSATVIRCYIERAVIGCKTDKVNVDMVIDSLNSLHEFAIKRVHNLSLKNQPDGSTKDIGDTILIPPLILEQVTTESPSLRIERGVFHRALKAEYPMLYSNSVKNEGVDHWIAVKVDDSFDGLVPHLLNPANDIRALLAFKKQGLQEEPARDTLKTKSRNGRDAGLSDTELQVILVLHPTITKDERKSVHHIIADRSKMFRTSTIPSYKLQDGTITTAIAVQWDKSSIGRKRKRQGDGAHFEINPDPYTNVLAVLKKRQKEHLTALNKLVQALRCNLSDIGTAGIKDLQAVTYQFCTFRNMKVRRLENANQQLKKYGIELGNFYRVNWVLNNGDLDGNDFRLIIRGLKRIKVGKKGETVDESFIECEESHLVQMVDRVKRSGFINFFGEQRVGAAGTSEIVGVRAFDIGRAMLQGDFNKAIELMMSGRNIDDSRESDAAKKVRQTWHDTSGDPSATLKAFQGADNILSRERMVLKGLNRYGRDKPLEAIRCLSHSVRTFWINAYQSYIWNQVASMRIQRYGTKPVKGDLYQENDSDEVKVLNCEDNASVSLSQVVLPLPGFNVRYPENEIADLYTELLRNDAITFEKSALAESSAKGGYRRLVVHPMMFTSEMMSSDVAQLSFQLPKGCYATMLLRELMLTTGTR